MKPHKIHKYDHSVGILTYRYYFNDGTCVCGKLIGETANTGTLRKLLLTMWKNRLRYYYTKKWKEDYET